MISVLQRQYHDKPHIKKHYTGIDIFIVIINLYGIGWFTDCGKMFFNIYFGKWIFEFSRSGLSFVERLE